MRRLLAMVVCASLAASSGARAQEQNLWEWMNVAPIVALLSIRDDGGRDTLAEVERVFRGELRAGDTVAIDLRAANRERPGGREALELLPGSSYLALLEPVRKKRDPERAPQFRIVRGVDGMRAMPPEGAPAWIAAAERVAAIRSLGSDVLVWEALGQLLSDPNPVLMRTALDAHVAFARGGGELFPSLLPLLDHPSPGVRAGASALSGICIGRDREAVREGTGREIVLRLIALARRDGDVAVRATATRSLAEVNDESTRIVLGEIAAQDPEQSVRFEAQRILFAEAPAPRKPD